MWPESSKLRMEKRVQLHGTQLSFLDGACVSIGRRREPLDGICAQSECGMSPPRYWGVEPRGAPEIPPPYINGSKPRSCWFHFRALGHCVYSRCSVSTFLRKFLCFSGPWQLFILKDELTENRASDYLLTAMLKSSLGVPGPSEAGDPGFLPKEWTDSSEIHC